MTVNELARAAGVPAGRVRYYARCGLLPAGRDPDNAYRRFAPQALARASSPVRSGRPTRRCRCRPTSTIPAFARSISTR